MAFGPFNTGGGDSSLKQDVANLQQTVTTLQQTADGAMPKAGGTFTGPVAAAAAGQDPAVSQLRNSKLVSAETDPTVNGEIVWVYE